MSLNRLFNGRLPKAVFFDLDGTLIDSVPDLSLAIDKMLVQRGFAAAGVAKARLWVGDGALLLVARALRDAYASNAATAIEPSSVEIDKAYQLFRAFYGDCKGASCLYPNTLGCLNALRIVGVKLALITNKPRRFTPALLEQHELLSFFDLLVCGDDLSQQKPHPEPLEYAMTELAVRPSDCVMVGDASSDIVAANAAGIKSVAVTYGYASKAAVKHFPATHFIDDLSELMG